MNWATSKYQNLTLYPDLKGGLVKENLQQLHLLLDPLLVLLQQSWQKDLQRLYQLLQLWTQAEEREGLKGEVLREEGLRHWEEGEEEGRQMAWEGKVPQLQEAGNL